MTSTRRDIVQGEGDSTGKSIAPGGIGGGWLNCAFKWFDLIPFLATLW